LLVSLREFESKELLLEDIPFVSGSQLTRFIEKSKPLVDVRLTSTNKIIITAGQKIGSLSEGGLTVHVAPRVNISSAAFLIYYSIFNYSAQNATLSARSMSKSKGYSFPDLIGAILCAEIKSIVFNGIYKSYQDKSSSLPFVRGRVDWRRSFPFELNRATAVCCNYQDISHNNLHNQIILFALSKLINNVTNKGIKASLYSYHRMFDELCDFVPIDEASFTNISSGYNRMNAHYQIAHSLCRLIINDYLDSGVNGGKSKFSHGFVFNMALVFEKFIGKFLRLALDDMNVVVEEQSKIHGAFVDATGKKYLSAKPDLLVKHEDKVVAVADIKYKPYSKSLKDGKPVKKVSSADLYQVFFYQQKIRDLHHLPELPLAFIFSDKHGAGLRDKYRHLSVGYSGDTLNEVHLDFFDVDHISSRLAEGYAEVDVIKDIGGELNLVSRLLHGN